MGGEYVNKNRTPILGLLYIPTINIMSINTTMDIECMKQYMLDPNCRVDATETYMFSKCGYSITCDTGTTNFKDEARYKLTYALYQKYDPDNIHELTDEVNRYFRSTVRMCIVTTKDNQQQIHDQAEGLLSGPQLFVRHGVIDLVKLRTQRKLYAVIDYFNLFTGVQIIQESTYDALVEDGFVKPAGILMIEQKELYTKYDETDINKYFRPTTRMCIIAANDKSMHKVSNTATDLPDQPYIRYGIVDMERLRDKITMGVVGDLLQDFTDVQLLPESTYDALIEDGLIQPVGVFCTTSNSVFLVSNHALSCNNRNLGTLFGKDTEPSLSAEGIAHTLTHATTHRARFTSSFVVVSPLIRTWMSAILLYSTDQVLTLFVAPHLKERIKRRYSAVGMTRGNVPKNVLHQLAKLVRFLNHVKLPVPEVRVSFPIAANGMYSVRLVPTNHMWKADKVVEMGDYYGLTSSPYPSTSTFTSTSWYAPKNLTSDGSLTLFAEWWVHNGQQVFACCNITPTPLIHIVCHRSVMRVFCGTKYSRANTDGNIWSMVFLSGHIGPLDMIPSIPRAKSSATTPNVLCGKAGRVNKTDYQTAGLVITRSP